MYLSLNWIKKFTDLSKSKLTSEELQNLVSTKVAEMEGYEEQAKSYENIVVGQILSLAKHPDADKLTICQVEVGLEEPVQIVCGGTNLEKDMLTVVALPGSQVRWHGEGDLITLKATKLRGEYSHGMICSSEEVGLGDPEVEGHIVKLEGDHKAGTPLSEALGLDDVIFEIDNKSITNRPDLWGHIGFAREVAAITDSKFSAPELKDIKEGSSPAPFTLKVHDPEISPRFMGLVIENLENNQSPESISKPLQNIGHSGKSLLVDTTNFVMNEFGQPMHAYDFDKIKKIARNDNPELEISYFYNAETNTDTFKGIDGNEYKLTPHTPLLIVNKTPICILGIMGGENTAVDENTTSILLESANFTDVVVRKASQALGLRSDSSQRFEKCLDPNLPEKALKKAVELLLHNSPKASINSKTLDHYPNPVKPLDIKLDLQRINSYLGTQLTTQEVEGLLSKVNITPNFSGEELTATVPTNRSTKDITIPEDIIEEIGRLYGYDKIPATLPDLSSQLPTLNQSRKLEDTIRQILKSQNLTETLNYSFYSLKDIENSLLEEAGHVKVKNYLSEEQTHMRTSLLPNLLKNIHANHIQFTDISLFEVGRSYHETNEFFPAEQEILSFIQANQEENFYSLKGKVEHLLNQLNIPEYKFDVEHEPPVTAHPNITASIKDKKGNLLGHIYRVHPKLLENFDIKSDTFVSYAELNLGLLIHEHTATRTFQELPKFPDMELDISVVLDKATTHQEVVDVLQNCSKLIHHIELFDIFEDESKLGQGKKALGYRMTLRSLDRTLTDEDLSQVQKKCYRKLEHIGGTIRS